MARPANMCSVKHDVLFAPRTRRARCIWAKDLGLTSEEFQFVFQPLFFCYFSLLAEREQTRISSAFGPWFRKKGASKRQFFAAGVQVPGPTCLIAIIRYR